MSDAKDKLEREQAAEKEVLARKQLRRDLYDGNEKLRVAIPDEAYLFHLLKEVERHFELWFNKTEPVAELEADEAIDLDDTDEIEKREQAADDAAAVESEKAAAAKDARRRAPSGLR
jgi:hypothetical protein